MSRLCIYIFYLPQFFDYYYNLLFISKSRHYDGSVYSKNGRPTIVPKKIGVTLKNPKDKTKLSSTDIREIKKYYSCR